MSNLEKKNIIVTGGAGFIGSFLCEALLKQGHRVICIDDFSTGHVRNINPYLSNPNFQFLRLDITKPFDLAQFSELEPFNIQFTGIQEIYHLASPTSINDFDAFRIPTALTNSLGTHYILEQAKKYKSRFLLGSTSVVYGGRTDEQQVFDEQYRGMVDHLSPRACYDESKRFAETLTQVYADEYQLDIRIARIFRTYGPRMPVFDGYMIPDMILAALNGESLVLTGHERFQTSLLYVADAVDGLMRLMQYQGEEKIMNIGSDQDLQMMDVAKKIIALTQSSSKVEVGDEHLFLTELGLPNIDVAKEKLGWLPVVQLEQGLGKTIDYIRANKLLLTQEG